MGVQMRQVIVRPLGVTLACMALCACTGLTQMQDSLNKFGAGATSVSATEMTFFKNVQSVDCSVQYYDKTVSWAVGAGDNYDLTGRCTPELLRNEQLVIRHHMLDAVTAYAAKMQALASAGGDKTLDSNAQALAVNLNKLATQAGGITKGDAGIAAGVEAALIQLATMALDEKRYKEARAAAIAMEPYLETIVVELKTENLDFANSIDSKRGALELELRQVVDRATTPTSKFGAVVNARNILRSSNPFGQEAISQASNIPAPDPTTLNSALDGLLSANKEIAHGSKGSIAAAVTDLVTRAQAAQADEAAIAKQ